MSVQEIKRGRGRPKKIIEANTVKSSSTTFNSNESINEYNFFDATSVLSESIFSCGIYDYFSKEDIENILRDPIGNHEMAIKLSEFVYTKNGIVTNSIDYMTALLCLDKIISTKKSTSKASVAKELMKSTLETIDDKHFLRDALFTQMIDGIAFYYLEVVKKNVDNTKFLNDYEVENIVEINNLGVNASVITLPWKYTKIVGKKNGRYVLAFNLRFFDNYNGESLERKLKKYPKEISDAYSSKNTKINNGDWLVLDNNHTMCRKIKCKDSEPWGRSTIIAALSDILYKDYFVDTKRNTLDEVNNKIIYQTLPEGEKKGKCALTEPQQKNQHETVKNAVMKKNNKGGTSFFTVASGTKLDSIDVNIDIFDSKNESALDASISMDLGICASLIGAMSSGTFAGGQQNLEMITSQLYTWICEWKKELEFVINKTIIQDDSNKVNIYYFPTSFVNRKEFFTMMESLYTKAGGSLTFLIASTGVDPDIYLQTLDDEIDKGLFEKYKPHQTSFTMSKDSSPGAPMTDTPTESSVQSRNNGGNTLPSASDNK
jgi:hypothetical protein